MASWAVCVSTCSCSNTFVKVFTVTKTSSLRNIKLSNSFSGNQPRPPYPQVAGLQFPVRAFAADLSDRAADALPAARSITVSAGCITIRPSGPRAPVGTCLRKGRSHFKTERYDSVSAKIFRFFFYQYAKWTKKLSTFRRQRFQTIHLLWWKIRNSRSLRMADFQS